jgi:glutathione peroxidase-family protein
MSIIHSLFGGLVLNSSTNASLYPLQTLDSSGAPVELGQYAGKVVLIVNTASQCGFTKQYDALEALHKKYSEQGLVVLGFPSNDFGGQEPGSDAEIESFCRINHGVSFRLFSKAPVKGANKQSVFAALTTREPRELQGEVRWNFEKFLLDRDGRLVGRWRSYVHPGWGVFERAVRRVLEG